MRIGRSVDSARKTELAANTELPRFGRRLEDDVIEHLVSFLQAVYNSRQDSQEKRARENYSSSLPKFGRQVRSNMDVPKFGRELAEAQRRRSNWEQDGDMGLSEKLQQLGLLPLLKFAGVTTHEDEQQGKDSEWQSKRGVSMLRFGRANPTSGDDDNNVVEDSEVKRQSPLLRFGKRQSPLVRFGKRTALQDDESFTASKRQAANILRFG